MIPISAQAFDSATTEIENESASDAVCKMKGRSSRVPSLGTGRRNMTIHVSKAGVGSIQGSVPSSEVAPRSGALLE
jgi:hypothetical protein